MGWLKFTVDFLLKKVHSNGQRGLLPSGVKRPRCEADQPHPSSVEVKMYGAVPPLPHYVFATWYLVKQEMSSWFRA